MREIEPQIIWRDDRAGLLHVRTKDFFQRRVNQMRRRVISPCRVAFFDIDDRGYFIADL